MMRAVRFVLMGALLTVAAGCDTGSKPAPTVLLDPAGFSLSDEDFRAYLNAKGIPDEPGPRRDRAKETFEQRNALAQAIARESLIDHRNVAAEVRDFRNELLIRRHLDAYAKTAVTDEAVKAQFEQQQQAYERRKLRVGQILLAGAPSMSESDKSALLARAVEAHNRLQAGADFADLAKEVSQDRTTAGAGGELGWVYSDQLEPVVAQKLGTLTAGQVSEPLSVERGYLIVKLLEEPVVETREFEAVRDRIRYDLTYQARQEEMQRLLGATGK